MNDAGQTVDSGAYTTYGASLTGTYPNMPFTWKGQFGVYRDSESGMMQMGARFYNPALGRFISRDPSGFSSGPNLYLSCSGDPVNFFDPKFQHSADQFFRIALASFDIDDALKVSYKRTQN